MKKIITLVAGIAIIFGTSTVAFADTATQTSNPSTVQVGVQVGVQTGNTLTLNLDDCLSKIEKVNPNIKIEDTKIKLLDTQYNYDKTRSTYPDSEDPNSVSYNMQKTYTWQKSLSDLNNEKHNRDEKLKSLKNDLTKQYLNALSDQQSIESIKAEIANLDKKIEKTSLKVKLGQLNSTELDAIETQKSDLQSKLNATQAQLESELLTIKQYLSIDLKKDIKLMPASKELVKFDETGIQSRLESALKRNYALQKEDDDIGLLKSQRGIYMSYDPMNSDLKIRSLDINIQQAQDKLENDKLSTQISLMKAYYDLKNKEDVVEAEKLNLQIAQSNFDSAEIKFNSGLIDNIDRESNRITLEEQKTKLQAAINDYMITAENFKILMEE